MNKNLSQAPEKSNAENRPQSDSDDRSSCDEAGRETQSSSAQPDNPENVSVSIPSKHN